EGRERGCARPQDEDEDPGTAEDVGDGAERQRRPGLCRERELSARAAGLPDGAPSERPRAERADLAVLPLADLLRQEAEGRQGGGRRPTEGDAAGRRPTDAEAAPTEGARPGFDAARDRRPDLPQHAAEAAGRRRAEATASVRALRPRTRRRAPASARLEGSLLAPGADRPRALVDSRHAPERQARPSLLDPRPPEP